MVDYPECSRLGPRDHSAGHGSSARIESVVIEATSGPTSSMSFRPIKETFTCSLDSQASPTGGSTRATSSASKKRRLEANLEVARLEMELARANLKLAHAQCALALCEDDDTVDDSLKNHTDTQSKIQPMLNSGGIGQQGQRSQDPPVGITCQQPHQHTEKVLRDVRISTQDKEYSEVTAVQHILQITNVHAELYKIKNFPKIPPHPKDILKLANQVNISTAVIKQLNPQYLHSPEIIKQVLMRIPSVLKFRFYDFIAENGNKDFWNLSLMSDFLNNEAKKCRVYDFAVEDNPTKKRKLPVRPQTPQTKPTVTSQPK